MHGNVTQWCSDLAKNTESDRVLRGSSCAFNREECQASRRSSHDQGSNEGFFAVFALPGLRLVRVQSPYEGSLGIIAEITIDVAIANPPKPPKPNDGPLGMKFVPLPKGTTYLGWNGAKGSAKKTEIKQDFEIAIHTVTQGQWQEVMGKNPSWFSRDSDYLKKRLLSKYKDHSEHARKIIEILNNGEDWKKLPVENVTWEDCQTFVKKFNENETGKGYVYRLPTATEWEYACRGGATTEEDCTYNFYFAWPTNAPTSKQANFEGDLARTTKVGSYAPNKLGLYDMHGNVFQWTSSGDPDSRIARGGNYTSYQKDCRACVFLVASKNDEPWLSIGLRLVRVPSAPAKK